MITELVLTGLKKVEITATTLPDAWFQTVYACIKNGRVYTVTEGSYEGQQRKELDWVTVHITHPHDPPLLPDMPPGMEHLNPVPEGMEYLERYLPYLMTARREEDEAYTYGDRLFSTFDQPSGSAEMMSQVDAVISKYQRGFGNNQACMTIATPSDIHLADPPCLRQIDTRIFTDEQRTGPPKLHFFVYFRSWDLYCGFPPNLAAIEHLQRYMAEMIGNEVEAGEIIATSKGGHIYDMYWPLVTERMG